MTTKEMIEVMQAYERGEQIERFKAHWEDCGAPIWDWHNYEYRVKPKPTYRPYKDADEFLAAQKEHGMYIRYVDSNTYIIIFYVNDVAVFVPAINSDGNVVDVDLQYEKLLNNYKWQDGTPCGVKEE